MFFTVTTKSLLGCARGCLGRSCIRSPAFDLSLHLVSLGPRDIFHLSRFPPTCGGKGVILSLSLSLSVSLSTVLGQVLHSLRHLLLLLLSPCGRHKHTYTHTTPVDTL